MVWNIQSRYQILILRAPIKMKYKREVEGGGEGGREQIKLFNLFLLNEFDLIYSVVAIIIRKRF